MTTTVSSKGQVVLPSPLRRRLGLAAGDRLEATIKHGHIVLIPEKPKKRKARIVISKITGMPVLSTSGPIITSEMIYKALALEDFP